MTEYDDLVLEGRDGDEVLLIEVGRRWVPSVRGGIRTKGWWNAGRIVDVMTTDASGGALLASDTGGLWRVTPDDPWVPFRATNVARRWLHPAVRCLGKGPNGDNHYYAGCVGGLYESDPTDPTLLTWREVPLPVNLATVRSVATVTVHGYPTRVVIALQNLNGGASVWWADASAETPLWVSALIGWSATLPGEAGKTFMRPANCVAATPDGVLVSLIDPGGAGLAVWKGSWESTQLELAPARTTSVNGGLRWVTVATTDARAWALSVDKAGGGLSELWRSDDHGASWEVVSVFTTTDHDGDKDNGLQEQRRITMSPVQPNVIAVGGLHPQVSVDGGHFFDVVGAGVVHADAYLVHFDPYHPEAGRILIATDGGVFTADQFGRRGAWSTDYNACLGGSLQFLSRRPARGFWGSMGQSAGEPPLVAGGLQDNGNVYTDLEDGVSCWISASGCDGGAAQFLPDGSLTGTVFCGSPSVPEIWKWTGAGFADSGEPIPVLDYIGLEVKSPPGIQGMCELVDHPEGDWSQWGTQLLGYGWEPGETTLYALAERGFMAHRGYYELADIPAGTGGLWSAASRSGEVAYVGTRKGRIFSISSAGAITEHPVAAPSGHVVGAVTQLCESVAAGTWAIFESGLVARLAADGSFQDRTPASGESYWGLACWDDPTRPEVFVAGDSGVWHGPPDAGLQGSPWAAMNHGLPAIPMPACLLVGRMNGDPALFLTTYGWGMWHTAL